MGDHETIEFIARIFKPCQQIMRSSFTNKSTEILPRFTIAEQKASEFSKLFIFGVQFTQTELR